MTLEEEAERATAMLAGKVVARVIRHLDAEVLIEFEDGTRLILDSKNQIELSITR